MIKRFKETTGRYITKIYGQDRLAYAHSDSSDPYDLVEWAERGGYPGSVIMFYDLENGEVYVPFEKKKDVLYSDPAYADGAYYFLQGDYASKLVVLYKYTPGETPETVTEFDMADIKLYNFQIIGEKVHVIAQNGDNLESYYPNRFSFALKTNETVELIEGDRVYIEAWFEEGWDDEHECAGINYRFYHKVIVKDFNGNTVSEELGSLYRAQDGIYWIS